MAALLLVAACLMTLSSACDICGDPSHSNAMMPNWQQGQQQQQQQQQQQMMMNMFNMMMQHNQWGNNMNPGNPMPTSGAKPSVPSGPSTGTATGCQGFADVVVLLDSSGSIGEDNFKTQLMFVSDLVGSFQLGANNRDGYQFSVVSFSENAKEEFNLKAFTSMRALKDAILKIPYQQKNTDTHLGLQFARTNSFQSGHGGRYGAVKIVIVITDGRSNQPTATISQADELRKFGALVLSIGVGNDVDPTELEAIASSKKNVFRVDNFDVLNTIRQEVEKRACEITIEEGGGSTGTRTGFDWQTYLKWCTEQQMMKGEREIATEILQSFEDYSKKEKKEDDKKKKEKDEKEKMMYMAEKIKEMQKHLDKTEKIGEYLKEMKHHHMFMVTAETIKFCPMDGMESDVMRLMMHGEMKWSPGRADQCNVEDMDKLDLENMTAVEVAQQIANQPQAKQIEIYFSGLKDSICAGLKTYVQQVKQWEDNFPQLKQMLGIMW